MSIAPGLRALTLVLALVLEAAALAGCSGLRIHDDSRAKLATEAREAYEKLKVGEIAATEQTNLAFLLGEEIKALRANAQLQADFTMLAMAAGDGPMAETVLEGGERLKQLGFDGAADALRSAQPQMDAALRGLRTVGRVFRASGVAPPDCRALPAVLALPDTLAADRRQLLTDQYPKYREQCRLADPRTHFGQGEVGQAYVAWNDARLAHDARMAEAAEAAKALRQASAEYQQQADALAAAQQAGPELQARLQAQAARVARAVKALKALDTGDESDEVLGALAELLTAAAGGPAEAESPSLQKALAVARELPSLAGDIAQYEASRQLPPVSALLLAMRQQALLAQAAQQRAALAQERVDILKARADALLAEAQRWRELQDALCSHAVLAAGAPHPGARCKAFAVAKSAEGAWSCTLQGQPVANCALAQPWKARLSGSPPGGPRRELDKAETAYLQAQFAAVAPTEQRFREIDLRHREALLARQTALRAWDNLITTPLVQLDNFHQTGLKPQELADFIVKALGFTAIAIGVSK